MKKPATLNLTPFDPNDLKKPEFFVPEKYIHINPQSKGNIGKSVETEDRVSFLDSLDIGWEGSDMDDSHRTFVKRHPGEVEPYTFGDTLGAKDALMNIHHRVRRSGADVHVIDSRAQAHAFIMEAMQELDFFGLCREDKIQITLFLCLSDELESMESIREFTNFGKGVANIVIVDNPARSAGKLYHGSAFQQKVMSLGAGQIKLPTLSRMTLMGMQGAEKRAGRSISFAEFASSDSGHLEPSMVKDIQWHLQMMYKQYESIAKLMLPLGALEKIKIQDHMVTENIGRLEDDDFGFNF